MRKAQVALGPFSFISVLVPIKVVVLKLCDLFAQLDLACQFLIDKSITVWNPLQEPSSISYLDNVLRNLAAMMPHFKVPGKSVKHGEANENHCCPSRL